MSVILVEGGRKLSGAVTVQGAKNSVLPMLAATVPVSYTHLTLPTKLEV